MKFFIGNELLNGYLFPEAFSFDQQLGTNSSNFKLVKLIGIDGNGKSFSALTAFIRDETQKTVCFTFKVAQFFYGQEWIQAISSDGGYGILAALRYLQSHSFFSDSTKHFRDIFHIIHQQLCKDL